MWLQPQRELKKAHIKTVLLGLHLSVQSYVFLLFVRLKLGLPQKQTPTDYFLLSHIRLFYSDAMILNGIMFLNY